MSRPPKKIFVMLSNADIDVFENDVEVAMQSGYEPVGSPFCGPDPKNGTKASFFLGVTKWVHGTDD